MAIGVWLGTGLQSPFAKDDRSEARQKMDQIMRYVEEDYVDTISRENLEDELISEGRIESDFPNLLKELSFSFPKSEPSFPVR